jgi:hypothetical protein
VVSHIQKCVVLLLVLSAGTCAQQLAPAAAPDLSAILARMQQAQQQCHNQRPYTLTRSYKLFEKDPARPTAEVTARLEFLPPVTKNYEIVGSSGSGRAVGVVKHILDNEAQLARTPGVSEISPRNYRFRLMGQRTLSGAAVYELAIEPLRKDRNLVDGRVLVDAQTYRIRRVEGELAHSPSWWLKKTYVAVQYGDVEGLWLPVATDGWADVRLLGRRSMTSRQTAAAVGAISAANRTAPPPLPARGQTRRPAITTPAALGQAVPLR